MYYVDAEEYFIWNQLNDEDLLIPDDVDKNREF